MIVYTPPAPPKAIPVVDLEGSFSSDPQARKRVAWEVHKACRETGFFYIANHRVARELVQAQFEWTQRFFALPLDDKEAINMKKSPTTAGYEPIGGQWLDSQDANAEVAPPDLKESFYCGMELPNDHPLAKIHARGFGFNQWPASLPGFKEQMLKYQAAMSELGDRVLAMIALSLDVSEDFFASFFDTPIVTLRLIKYPPHPANALYNQLGAGAHTDWGGITLLAQDASGGLEVRNAAGDWIEATPIPDTLVINLGDLMARWTNGLYNSNMHRVKNNKTGADRYSVPFFYSPRPDSRIECISTCVTADTPAQFEPCTARDHLNEMFRRSYGFAPAA